MINNPKLEFFPVSAFTTVMGLTGFAMAVKSAEQQMPFGFTISPALLVFSLLLFLAISVLYLVKFVRFRQAVLNEFNHPVKLQFFPAISISMVLLATALHSQGHAIAVWVWGAGSLLHLLFTLLILNAWLNRSSIEVIHSNPSWFIPVVGNILIPIGGVSLAPQEISWFFFSIGLVFWMVLFTLIFYRLVFHPAMPAKLLPTLAILLAPPAVGFLSWLALTGELDAFGRILYYSALIITLLLLVQAPRFMRLRFALSSWAYSFPLAAMTMASMAMAKLTAIKLFTLLAYGLLAFLTVIIIALVIYTIRAMRNDEICIDD